jgi:hypothetical protein
MLLTDIKQESMVKRIENVVSAIMEERPIFKEDLDYSEIVQDLVNIFKKIFLLNEFNNISEESLKNRCSGIMAVELLATIGEGFYP